MPVSRDESQRRTRERLIAAARDVVGRLGYGGSSIGAIAEAAGFTKGAFFSNFDSKDALLLEVMRLHHEAELEGLEALLGSTDRGEPLDQAIASYVNTLAADTGWVLLSTELALQAARDPAFAARYTPMRQAFAKALGALLATMYAADGLAMNATPEDLGSLMLSVVQGISLTVATGTNRPSAGELVAAVSNGLKALAPRPGKKA